MALITTRKTVQSGNSVGLTIPSAWNIVAGDLVNVAVHKTESDGENNTVFEATLKVCYRGRTFGVHLPASWGIGVGEMVTATVEPLEKDENGLYS